MILMNQKVTRFVVNNIFVLGCGNFAPTDTKAYCRDIFIFLRFLEPPYLCYVPAVCDDGSLGQAGGPGCVNIQQLVVKCNFGVRCWFGGGGIFKQNVQINLVCSHTWTNLPTPVQKTGVV